MRYRYLLALKQLNIHETKTHLSQYLALIERGEAMLLCCNNRPIAEIRPLEPSRQQPRPIGLAKGLFTVPGEFFEPLPTAVVEEFEGQVR